MDEYDNGAASSAPTKRKTRARSVVAASKVAPAEAKKAKVAKSDGVGKKRLNKTAAEPEVVTSVTTKKAKPDRATERLTQELEEQKDQNARLLQELKEAREALNGQQITSPPASEFGDYMGPSSTGFSLMENSRILSSIHQLSANSINVPECKPMGGDQEIHRVTFETWKDLLMDNMKLAGIEDEQTKFTLFKVKAGAQLLEVFKNTVSDSEAPDSKEYPFQNAMHRLSVHFASGSDGLLQRRRMALMAQETTESDLAFLMRVATMARQCGFDEQKQFEEVVSVVSQNALDPKVRAIALKMTHQTHQTDKDKKANFKRLTDKVREVEAIRLNEELVRKKNGAQTAALVAPVRPDYPTKKAQPYHNDRRFGARNDRYHPYQNTQRSSPAANHPYQNAQRSSPGAYHPYHNAQRSSPGTNRQKNTTSRRPPENQSNGTMQGGVNNASQKSNNQRNVPPKTNCWRCYGDNHTPEQCYASNKDCRKCGQIGHLARMCASVAARRTPDERGIAKTGPGRIAMVDAGDTDAQDEETVSPDN